MTVKQSIVIPTLCLVVLQWSFSQDTLDVVHLKSGGKIIGTIIEKTDTGSIHIQLQSKDVIVLLPEETVRIENKAIVYYAPIASRTLIPSKHSRAKDTHWEIKALDSVVAVDATLDSLCGSTLFFSQEGLVDSIEIESIAELRSIRESRALTYALYGSLIGAGVGWAIGASLPEPQGLALGPGNEAAAAVIGIGSGFAVGAIVGGQLGIDVIIRFPKGDSAHAKTQIEGMFKDWYE